MITTVTKMPLATISMAVMNVSIHQCHGDGFCTDGAGSYTCTCNPGFNDVNDDSRKCEDISQCELGTDHIDYVGCNFGNKCVNTHGDAHCQCVSGYKDIDGDGNNCEEIDGFITLPDTCFDETNCTYTYGS